METLVFPRLDRPWGPFHPSRIVDPQGMGPLYKDVQNMVMHDGKIRIRETILGGHTVTAYTPLVSGDSAWRAQLPRLILDISDDDEPSRLLVTSREILLYHGGSWANLTPVYTTGTISIASGTTVTGTGTAWSDRGVTKGNFIKVGTTWHVINSVTNNTSLELVTAYTGAAQSGDTYTIRRAFLDESDGDNPQTVDSWGRRNFFAQVFNGDLYIAGAFGIDGDGVVLRIPNITDSTSPTVSDVEYLFSGATDYTASIDEVGEISYIYGMQVIESGQVILAIRVPGTTPRTSRIRYSDPSDATVWTSAPGGFTDTVSKEGPITALGRLGTDLTLHYPDGIVLGYLTGESDPPISYRSTRAEFGTTNPMALVNVHGMEVFPSIDFNIRQFTGSTTPILSNDARYVFEQQSYSVSDLASYAWAYHYTTREEYRIFFPKGTTAGGTRKTEAIYVDLATGGATKHRFGGRIGAAVERPVFLDGAGGGGGDGNQDFLRFTSKNSTVFGFATIAGTAASFTNLCFLTEANIRDSAVTYTGDDVTDIDGIYFQTIAMDLGLPHRAKHVEKVGLTYRPFYSIAGFNNDILISVSYDNGATWSTHTEANVSFNSSNTESLIVANFPQKSGSAFSIKVEADNDASLSWILGIEFISMVVYYTILEDLTAAA